MPQPFPTSVGTVEIVVQEASRIVSIARLGSEGRPVASRMCDWDADNLTQVLTEMTIPYGEASAADQVQAEHGSVMRVFPQPVGAAPTNQVGYGSPWRESFDNAGVALRFVAVLLDSILVFFPLGIVLGLMTGGANVVRGPGYTNAGVEIEGDALLMIIVLVLAYYVFAEALTGMTLGKRLVGIRVVDEAGEHVAFGPAVVRNLFRLIDGFLFYLVGALFAFSPPKCQRLGDRAAHTLVVRR